MITSDNSSTPSTTLPSPSADDLLTQIEEMAAALMTVRDIALLTDMSSEETDTFVYAVKNNLDNPLAKAYRKGRLRTKLALRRKVVDFALKGSPAAQPLADEYLKENELL